MANTPKKEKMTEEQFTLYAIEKLRKPYKDTKTGEMKESKGIHTRMSGFNDAFRSYFPDGDPIATTKALSEANKIAIAPRRGGVMIYIKGEEPAVASDKGADALKAMGL